MDAEYCSFDCNGPLLWVISCEWIAMSSKMDNYIINIFIISFNIYIYIKDATHVTSFIG